MSSVTSKLALSGIVGIVTSKNFAWESPITGLNVKENFNFQAAAAAYFAATVYDIIDFFRGDTRYIDTRDEKGKFVTKQYEVHKFDFVKCSTNVCTLAGLSVAVLESNTAMGFGVLLGGIAVESAADLFNLDWSTEVLYEINDEEMIINDF